MKRLGSLSHHHVLLILVPLVAQALAQVATPPPSQMTQRPRAAQNPLVGMWQTSITLQQGLPPVTGRLLVLPDGRYREELYAQGQLAAFWEGTYTLTADGTLTQTETSKSPRLCLPMGCVSNDGPTTTVSRLTQQGPNAVSASVQDPSTGQTFTIQWQRVQNQTAKPGMPAPPPGAVAVPMRPGTPGQARPGAMSQPPGGSPLPAGGGWNGTFVGNAGQLIMVVQGQQGSYAGYLELSGQRYPFQASGDERVLQGMFQANGSPYEFNAERYEGTVYLYTGDTEYVLTPANPAPNPGTPAGNPLGN